MMLAGHVLRNCSRGSSRHFRRRRFTGDSPRGLIDSSKGDSDRSSTRRSRGGLRIIDSYGSGRRCTPGWLCFKHQLNISQLNLFTIVKIGICDSGTVDKSSIRGAEIPQPHHAVGENHFAMGSGHRGIIDTEIVLRIAPEPVDPCFQRDLSRLRATWIENQPRHNLGAKRSYPEGRVLSLLIKGLYGTMEVLFIGILMD